MAPKKYKKPTTHSSPQAFTTSSLFHTMLGNRSQQLYNQPKPQLQHQSSNADNPTTTNVSASMSVGSMINTTHTKAISSLTSVKDPNQYIEGVHSSGEDFSETFELDLTSGETVVNTSGIVSEVLPSETLPWVTINHAVRLRVLFDDAGGEKPLVVKAPVQVSYMVGRESINLASGRPVLQETGMEGQGAQGAQGAQGVDEWMYSENVPGYEYRSDGGEEDVLPGYGEDVGRSNLLDSNVRNNQQYGLSVK